MRRAYHDTQWMNDENADTSPRLKPGGSQKR